MTIEIITPEKTIYSGSVTLAQFPGVEGSFEVLTNHAPMVAALNKGSIKLKDTDNRTFYIEIEGGVVQVESNKLLVLADG